MKNNSKNPTSLNRTKKIAATVAALGAALGMNLQDVLANPSAGSKKSVQSSGQPRTLTPSEIDRVKKLRKGSSTVPPGLQKRPDTLAFKVTPKDQLTTRPPARTDKTSRPGLKTRPSVQGDKISPLHQNRPDLKTQ
jgi:hypothetical protein